MKKLLILFAFLLLLAGIVTGAILLFKNDESTCAEHKDFNADGVCDVCVAALSCESHTDDNHDGSCDIYYCEKNLVIVHADNDGDGKCDAEKCSKELNCNDENEPDENEPDENDTNSEIDAPTDVPDGKTEECYECKDENFDLKCDLCGKDIEQPSEPSCDCRDADENGVCDNCGEPIEKIEEEETEYEVTSLTIAGISVSEYVITYDLPNSQNQTLAFMMRDLILEKSGISLDVENDSSEITKRKISIASRQKSGGEGFYVKITESKDLLFISEYDNKTESAFNDYLSSLFTEGVSTVEFVECTLNVRDIFYSDFGAVGDGAADDYAAISSAHEYANEYGHTVVAKKNAFYRVASIQKSIELTSDVNWNNATFVIDGECLSPLFHVKSKYSATADSGNPKDTTECAEEKISLKDVNFLLNSCTTCVSVNRSNTEFSGITVDFASDVCESVCSEKAYLTVYDSVGVTVTDYRFTTPQHIAPNTSHYALKANDTVEFTLLRCSQNNFFSVDGFTPSTDGKGILSFERMRSLTVENCLASILFVGGEVYDSKMINSVFYEADIENLSNLSTDNLFVYKSDDQ